MFSKTVIDSDAFLDMPLSTQALYFHFAMRADDDGLINNARKIQRMLGASDDDCKLLVAKDYIICFDSGIVAVTHWKQHNYIQKDRYRGSKHLAEKNQLLLKDDKTYEKACIQDVYRLDTQDSIGKLSIDKDRDSIGKDSKGECEGERKPNFTPLKSQTVEKSVENSASLLLGSHANVQLTDKELARLKLLYPAQWERMIEDLSAFMATTGKKYDRHYDIITGWAGGSV
jgi:hypothetical protein